MISRTLLYAGALGLALLLVGCSEQSPTESASTTMALDRLDSRITTTGGDPVQLVARVATRDQNRLMLTFMDCPDTVIANQNCQIVRLGNQGEAPIPFSGLNPGDSVQVNGQQNQNGYVYAHRIAVCAWLGSPCDVAIRDTIASIDYAAGTFTVRGRTETIVTDAETIIRGTITHIGTPMQTQDRVQSGDASCSGPGHYTYMRSDTLLSFADLAVDDVVEIRANIVDDATLYAVMIKLANCDVSEKKCVEFTGTLATIELTTRIVSFTDVPWIGYVCPGAKLTDALGATLTLADFAAGELVAVKGQLTTADTLKISQMQKTTP